MINEEFYNIVDSLALINEDEEKPVPTVEEVEKEEKTKSDPRADVKKSIEPQVDVANSVITSIKDAFEDNCDQSKKIANMEDQIKNWEKTIRGACEQIVITVKNKGLKIDKTICSPRAFKKISNSSSRDLSVLDLCASIIVFFNSLG